MGKTPEDPVPTLPNVNPDTLVRAMRNRSERIAWWVAGAEFVVLLVGLAWPRVFPPAPTVEYQPVYVNEFGQKRLPAQLNVEKISVQEASHKHDLERWAAAFHSYSYDFLPRDWHTVQCTSPAGIFNEYKAQFEQPGTEDYIDVNGVKANIVRYAKATTTTLLGPNQTGGYDARIEMEVQAVHRDRQADQQPRPKHFVLTVQYRYDSKLKLSPECRSENPLGFVVTVRRADAQLVPPVAKVGAAS
jgi:type IV secretory pathway component VirB8